MLYAATSNKEHIPLGWEEVEYLWRKFTGQGATMSGYQLVWERKLFAGIEGPEIRCVLRRWESRGLNQGMNPPEVLLATSEPKQMAAVLFMLVSEVEASAKNRWFDGSNGMSASGWN